MKRLKLALLILLVMAPGARGEETLDGLLDRGLRSDEPYAYELSRKAAVSAPAERKELLKEALKYSPDMPALYFELSKASLPEVFSSFDYALGGVKAYMRNFWWVLSLSGLLYVGLLGSLVVCLLVVVLIRMPMDISLIAHDIAERKARLVAPLILIPLSLLGPMFLIAGALALAGVYMEKLDRIVIYISFILILFSPLALGFADLFFSSPSPELRAIVAVNEGKDSRFALRTLGQRKDFQSEFSYALALKREGRYQESIAVYEKILNEDGPDMPLVKVYNNLANAYFVSGQTTKARENYNKALELDSSVVILYNLSQLYRDMLDYENGDKYFNEALGRDGGRVSGFTALSSRNPNRLVIDETLSKTEFWGSLGGKRERAFNPYTVSPAGASIAAFVLIGLFWVYERKAYPRAYRCSRCDTVVCARCARTVKQGQMCAECYHAIVKMVNVDPERRVAKLLEAQERRGKKERTLKFLMIAPPGVAHIFVGRAFAGMLLMWPFLFAVFVMALNPLFRTGLAGFNHGWLTPLMIVLIVGMYLINIISVRRLEGEWL